MLETIYFWNEDTIYMMKGITTAIAQDLSTLLIIPAVYGISPTLQTYFPDFDQLWINHSTH